MRTYLAVCLAISFCLDSVASGQEPLPIEDAMTRFVNALDNLNWQEMSSLFDANATMFSPSPAERMQGPEVGEAWQKQFESLRRQSNKSGPPYLNITPQNMRIDRISSDVAIVSFHLRNGTAVQRRTLVWKHLAGGWKIVHLHASSGQPAD